MFENLKAFIRHGKQANDMKKKHIPQSINRASSPGNATTSGPNSIIDHDAMDTMVSADEFDDRRFADFALENFASSSENTLKDVQEYVGDNNANYNTTANTNGNRHSVHENHDYQRVATHIVEQENLQKQKSVKYPNLDNYEVLEHMGEGAFSVVYKARQLSTDKLVAIKILRKFQMDSAQKSAVLKEVSIMRQLHHPNIVKFIEFIDSQSYYYIVQELAPGGEIFTAIVKYTYFSEDLARHVIKQVAEAIKYLHEEVGIVHRDIKPENLLYVPIEYTPSKNPIAKLRKSDDPNSKQDEGEFIPGVGAGCIGIVKLADFGLSKQIWEQNTKTPCGTVGYTAPEIVRDERYSREVDMWAIGCVLYTLLCGFPPFYDESIETLTEKVAKGEYTFLSPWWDEISSDAKNCVSKLLTVEPTQRYSVTDFLNDPWLNKLSSVESKVPPPQVPVSVASTEQPLQQRTNKYSKKYRTNNELYSPAAVALRDAFDISAAVHRMGEEAAFAKMNAIEDVVEEDEEDEYQDEVDSRGQVVSEVPQKRSAPRYQQKQQHRNLQQNNVFDLNLGGASILERRKYKQVPVRG
ncbi:kinase-like domain-containing protein [Scheffersomyces xylosifermentans]|uniref:kinase-like domain-containing protein n=1 Tax=Scheffersomyces xylosifermentans TaxID=1304137 RepID=UPI00315CE774